MTSRAPRPGESIPSRRRRLGDSVMLRLIWNTSTCIRTFMGSGCPPTFCSTPCAPGEGCAGASAMLLSVGYFAIASWCTTLIADGGPGWLHLIVLLCIINAFKFLINGPITVARLHHRPPP